RSHGVCKRHKQVEYPGPTCQKAPSVAVTRGWGSHDLLADLGNNALHNANPKHNLRGHKMVLVKKQMIAP
ncbi:hypothetical protein, partial [Aeromonas enteropelogenes]|uniref:hypothetical protein n=1 Tax=Aeromonas enteropelogenes TaxID=29489 RepID=UPI001C8779BD